MCYIHLIVPKIYPCSLYQCYESGSFWCWTGSSGNDPDGDLFLLYGCNDVHPHIGSANLPITPSFKVFINKARFYTKCQDPDPLKFSGFLFKWSGFGTLFSRWPCTQPFLLYNYLECKLSNGTNVFCTIFLWEMCL